ncbi:FecR domain-containing protein [Mucilaginibacter sp.]|uniref:FecR family protein n=1 Tax=Mucilaginibacter sp. TaxID=1882438 RepID=UPI0032662D8F
MKKRNQASDSSLQEKLVEKYFDGLNLDEQKAADHGVAFEKDKVYSRIIAAIDEPVQQRGSSKKWMVAASVIAIIGLSAIVYQFSSNIVNYLDPIKNKQLIAANGQVVNYTLADGTKVWLNGGSKLTYPAKFRGNLREITLEGEAFLEVAHDAERSFIVHTGGIRTQVLGTSFNVKAYPEDAFVKVDVVTGKVGVIPATAQTVFLTPAEEVFINKKDNTALKTTGVDIAALTDWKDGGLVFKNMALQEVLNALQHRYNIKIKADDNLAKCSISANFTNVSLQNIMVIISKLVKGKVVQEGQVYHFKGKGC